MVSKKRRLVSPYADDDLSGKALSADPPFGYWEKKVRFSLRECDTQNYCISNCKTVLPELYKRLGHFEEMKWGDVRRLGHDNGISIEPKDSENQRIMEKQSSLFKTFGHFRVSSRQKPLFRVFGAISEDLFYILRFDVDGSINH